MGRAAAERLAPNRGSQTRIRTTKNNRTYAVLSLATKRTWRDKQTGERVSRTEWHRVIAWAKLGDFPKTVAKGSHVRLDGELRSRTYTGKGNVRRRVYEVHLGSIHKLDRIERPAQPAATVEQPVEANAGVPF